MVLAVYSITVVIQLSTLLRGDSITFWVCDLNPISALTGWRFVGSLLDFSEPQFLRGDNNTSLEEQSEGHCKYLSSLLPKGLTQSRGSISTSNLYPLQCGRLLSSGPKERGSHGLPKEG